MIQLGKKRSNIRELFEYGRNLASKIGPENVYDFTLGNPSVPTPDKVNEAAIGLMKNPDTHMYTSAEGALSVRKDLARFNREKYGMPISENLMYMTCGAAAGLAISLTAAISDKQNEVVVLAPFFPEYRVFTEAAGGKTVVVPLDEADFQVDFEAFAASLTEKTAAVIVNSPNNPSGIVYSGQTLSHLAEILRAAERKYGTVITLISDEPYREIVYGPAVESPLSYYDDSVLCYSFSKSFSLPGERIGFLAVNEKMTEAQEYFYAIAGAGRSLGYVCAPSLFQRVVAKCCAEPSDVSVYRKNRDVLTAFLRDLGLTVANPDGAFYLLVKSPDGNSQRFSDMAKERNLLIVPTDSFGAPGYVRIATCVSVDVVERSLPVFKKLVENY